MHQFVLEATKGYNLNFIVNFLYELADDFIINKTGDKRSHSIAHDDDVQQTYFSKTMELFFTPRLEIFLYLWRECGWESRWCLRKGSPRVLSCLLWQVPVLGGQHCPVSTGSRDNMLRSVSRPGPPQGPGTPPVVTSTRCLEVIMSLVRDTWWDVN